MVLKMKDMKRSLRRHETKRIKCKVKKEILRSSWYDVDPIWLARNIGMRTNTGTLCSCFMCSGHKGSLPIRDLRKLQD